MTIDQSRLCPSQLCEGYPLNRISLTRLPPGSACVHGWSAALADRKRQFHPDLDVINKQRYTSLAGGTSPVLIMVQRLPEWCQGWNVLDSTDLESRANRPCVRAANAFASTAGRSRAQQRTEELNRGANRQGGGVAVSTELDVDSPRIMDLMECLEDGRKVHGSRAEHQVFMDAAYHVLDVQVEDARSPAEKMIGDRAFLDAMDMPDVHRQVEKRVADLAIEPVKAGEGIDEHARFGLEGQWHAREFGMPEHGSKCVSQPIHGLLLGGRVLDLAGPERDALRVKCASDVDGPAQKVGPDGPAAGIRVHQGRVVLEPRVEQVPPPGLDNPCQSPSVQARANRGNLAGKGTGLFVGIERAHVQGDRHALETLGGNQVDGVRQAMVGQAVGVISESHVGIRKTITWSKAIGPAGRLEPRAPRLRRRPGVRELLRPGRHRSRPARGCRS